jgi:hypothetical protein
MGGGGGRQGPAVTGGRQHGTMGDARLGAGLLRRG